MSSFSLKLNRSNLELEFTRALGNSTEVKMIADRQFRSIFNAAHRVMIKEFDRHPITSEIDAGPRAVNLSETLGGYGNLFSFIGFEAGSEPTQNLKDLLMLTVNYRQTVYRNRAWYFKVYIPSKEDIADASPMPWEAGNSWALQIEKSNGISGLSAYMYAKWNGGRSKQGFQLPYENQEDAAFSAKPYLSEILANFKNRINHKE